MYVNQLYWFLECLAIVRRIWFTIVYIYYIVHDSLYVILIQLHLEYIIIHIVQIDCSIYSTKRYVLFKFNLH